MSAAGAMDHLIGAMRKQQDPQMPPDCVGRFLCTKFSWRGRYRRFMCITPTAVITQHPDNLAITNTYTFVGETDIDTVSVGASEPEEQEFTLSTRSDKKVRPCPSYSWAQRGCRGEPGRLLSGHLRHMSSDVGARAGCIVSRLAGLHDNVLWPCEAHVSNCWSAGPVHGQPTGRPAQ